MVIFHSYVKLLKGIGSFSSCSPNKNDNIRSEEDLVKQMAPFYFPICSPGMQRVATRRYELVMPSDHTDPDKLLLILQRHPKFKVFGRFGTGIARVQSSTLSTSPTLKECHSSINIFYENIASKFTTNIFPPHFRLPQHPGIGKRPFLGYWTSPYSSHLIDHIPNGWVMFNGDV